MNTSSKEYTLEPKEAQGNDYTVYASLKTVHENGQMLYLAQFDVSRKPDQPPLQGLAVELVDKNETAFKSQPGNNSQVEVGGGLGVTVNLAYYFSALPNQEPNALILHLQNTTHRFTVK